MITFEFDGTKSQANLLKHGIHFIDAQALWDDPNLLEIPRKHGRRAALLDDWADSE